jgi:ABC-type arginine transport system ATPase subunit
MLNQRIADHREIEPEAPPDDVAIRLQCVELRYGPKIVLSDCSMDCRRGEITCVIDQRTSPRGAGSRFRQRR